MPRVSGVYTQPFPDVAPATTIESTVYNGFTHDVETDLNTPRPISSGGTGADNAADAMSNLGGEGSKIEVTNYDSHNFTAGSFYSKSTATNPPVAGHAFAGICYVAVVSGVATSDLFIEVRDRDDLTQPGSLFVRQKKAGVWSGWLKATGTSMGPTPPATPTDGALWWDKTRGKLFVFYTDVDTGQWVEAVAVPEVDEDEIIDTIDESAVRYDADQALTEAQGAQARSNIYAAPFDALAYSGMQINGGFDVSQERGTTAITASGAVCDGWRFYNTTATAVIAAQGNTGASLPGISNLIYAQTTPAMGTPAAADMIFFLQNIEGYRVARLGWGTAQARPITIGFWCQHNQTGTYSVSVRNSSVTRSYSATYTQNVSNIVEYKTVTIPGCTDGVWEKTNLAGIEISFMAVCGSTNTAPTANVWASGTFLAAPGQANAFTTASNAFRITGVVVLPGIEAPSAERSALIMRPYSEELLTCQRYFQFLRSCSGVTDANSFVAYAAFPVEMRSAPTLAIVGGSVTSGVSLPGVGFLNITSIYSQNMYTRDGQIVFNTSVIAALKPGGLYPPNILNKLTLDARL